MSRAPKATIDLVEGEDGEDQELLAVRENLIHAPKSRSRTFLFAFALLLGSLFSNVMGEFQPLIRLSIALLQRTQPPPYLRA